MTFIIKKADQRNSTVLHCIVLYCNLVRLQNIVFAFALCYVCLRNHFPLEWCGGWEKLLKFLSDFSKVGFR